MASLRDLIRMFQSSPLDYVPEAGVRPGYGLQGASVRASDLPDQLRNAERKEGSMPAGPGGMLDDWMRVAAQKGLTQEQAIKGAMTVMEDPDYYGRTGFKGLVESLLPKETLSMRDQALREIASRTQKF